MTTHPFFLELKSAREAKGLTLAQISDITRIIENHLEAIERGDIAILPQAYVRAFIREYADTVGLDPAEIMRKYDAMLTGAPASPAPTAPVPTAPVPTAPVPTAPVPTAPVPMAPVPMAPVPMAPVPMAPVPMAPVPERYSSGPGAGPSEKLFTAKAAGVALGVVSVAAIAVLLWNIMGKTSPTATEEIPFQSVLADKDRRLSPAPSSSPAASPVHGGATGTDSLTLRGLTSDTVWVMVSTDSMNPREFIFKPNVQFSFKAKSRFSVTLGNAGAVTFTLNQKELGTLGKPGAVVRNYEITRASLGAR